MSRSGEIDLWLGEEKRTFRLGLKELRQLQEKCADSVRGERGPMAIMRDLQSGTWRVNDVIYPLQLGLEGAGVKQEDAAKLVRGRLEDRSDYAAFALTAAVIINAAMTGPKDDQIDVGKREAEEGPTTMARSPSPNSSDRPPSSDGQLATSTVSAGGNSRQRSPATPRRTVRTRDQ